jgi:hypothetical protein
MDFALFFEGARRSVLFVYMSTPRREKRREGRVTHYRAVSFRIYRAAKIPAPSTPQAALYAPGSYVRLCHLPVAGGISG